MALSIFFFSFQFSYDFFVDLNGLRPQNQPHLNCFHRHCCYYPWDLTSFLKAKCQKLQQVYIGFEMLLQNRGRILKLVHTTLLEGKGAILKLPIRPPWLGLLWRDYTSFVAFCLFLPESYVIESCHVMQKKRDKFCIKTTNFDAKFLDIFIEFLLLKAFKIELKWCKANNKTF